MNSFHLDYSYLSPIKDLVFYVQVVRLHGMKSPLWKHHDDLL